MFEGKDQITLSANMTNCEKTLQSVVPNFDFAYLCLCKSEIYTLKLSKLH